MEGQVRDATGATRKDLLALGDDEGEAEKETRDQ
jgi:hypothetical protein